MAKKVTKTGTKKATGTSRKAAPAKKAAGTPAKKSAKRKAPPSVTRGKAAVSKPSRAKVARASKPGAPKPVVLETEVIHLPDIDPVEETTVEVQQPAPRVVHGVAGVVMPAGDFAVAAARMCRDDHCEDVVLMDVRAVSAVTDYIVVASGTSDRQMRSVQRHVEELGASLGNPAVRTSSDDRATWLIADFVDVVVHLFEPGTRSHYDLEMLWGDAPRVAWEREDQKERDRAGIAAN